MSLDTRERTNVEELKDEIQSSAILFHLVDQLKKDLPSSDVVPSPKTPVRMTEPLMANLIDNNKVLSDVSYKNVGRGKGRKTPDILGKRVEGGIDRIELKATHRGFQNFTQSDIDSDWLIWADLSDLLKGEKGCNTINVYAIKNPSDYFSIPDGQERTLINLDDFLSQCNESNNFYRYEVDLEQYGLIDDEFSADDECHSIMDTMTSQRNTAWQMIKDFVYKHKEEIAIGSLLALFTPSLFGKQ